MPEPPSEMPVSKAPGSQKQHRCPCCKFKTLYEQGGYEICPVCFWEDDGQGDADAHEVWGGPNGSLSLSEARANFARRETIDARFKSNVRKPLPDEI
jgi:hypothetical protein